VAELGEMARGTATVAPPVVLTAGDIDRIRWEPLPEVGEGVSHQLLWRSGASLAGVMRVEQGGCVSSHAHRQAHHHIWVLSGQGRVMGRAVGAGSYVHVPAGVDHEVDAASGELIFLYLYLQY
jgi:quercetin dioxygenase-like cupin family protein